MEFSNRYIVGFAVILCLVCALGVSSAAVGLRDLQQTNELLFKQKNVLMAAGIMEAGAEITPEEVTAYFENIHERVIDRVSGAALDEDSSKIDPIKLATDEDASTATPTQFKATQVRRLSNKLLVYEVNVAGHEGLVLPIHGSGLWSTLFGFIALSPDGMTIKGLTYYAHGETPGLGGEVENPKWRAQWPGKLAVDADGKVLVQVLKPGLGENPDTDVDGLSGATITSNGVHNMLQLWLGEHGYGPYLATKR